MFYVKSEQGANFRDFVVKPLYVKHNTGDFCVFHLFWERKCAIYLGNSTVEIMWNFYLFFIFSCFNPFPFVLNSNDYTFEAENDQPLQPV